MVKEGRNMYQHQCSGQCQQSCGCQMNWNHNNCFNGCPKPQPLVAPKRVCVSQQVTPVPQPVICPIECRRVNRCMYFPVFYPQYEHTFMTVPFNQSY